jgi:hypothetical protein
MAKDSNIQNELKDISQAVANLDGKTPFAIPADYFQQFPKKLMQKIENESFIKEECALCKAKHLSKSPQLISMNSTQLFQELHRQQSSLAQEDGSLMLPRHVSVDLFLDSSIYPISSQSNQHWLPIPSQMKPWLVISLKVS